MRISIPASQQSSNGNGHHNGNGHRSGNGTSITKRPASAARVDANRRNARQSTGPRSAEGKRRASMNALKHGACANSPLLPGECGTTFNTFAEEVRADLRPRTAVEMTLVRHITNALWRLERIGDVERAVLRIERQRMERKTTTPAKMKLPPRLAELEDDVDAQAADGTDGTGAMWPCEVIARCFTAEDPGKSPLLLVQRYERSLHNTVMRLMARLDVLKRRDNAALYDPTDLERRGERPPPAPPRPAPRAPVGNEANAEAAKTSVCDGRTRSEPEADEVGRRNEAKPREAAPGISLSPGTPGEDRGEDSSPPARISSMPQNPHPNPLPEYRARGPERQPTTSREALRAPAQPWPGTRETTR